MRAGIPLLLAFASVGCVSDAPPRSPMPADTGAAQRSFALGDAPARGDELERLDALVGDWEAELTDASGAHLARGEARIDWCLDGRFLGWDARFELERSSFPSRGMLGFDAGTREYQWVWASGWSGRASLAHGRGELDGSGLRLVAEESDPATGVLVRARSVLRLLDPDRFEIAQDVEGEPGTWRPTTRTVYTRRESAPAIGP